MTSVFRRRLEHRAGLLRVLSCHPRHNPQGPVADVRLGLERQRQARADQRWAARVAAPHRLFSRTRVADAQAAVAGAVRQVAARLLGRLDTAARPAEGPRLHTARNRAHADVRENRGLKVSNSLEVPSFNSKRIKQPNLT